MSVYYLYDPSEPVPFAYLTPCRFTGRLPPPYKTTTLPPDYLEFAIADLADGSNRGLVNAFGNAKRALHFEVDCLLQQYGLFCHFGRTNFPMKLQYLDDIGLLPITIITNLNVERNLVEHEYDTPPRKRVAEAIDVVKLLLFATEKLMEATPHEAIIGWRQPHRHMLMQLDPIAGEISFSTVVAKGRYTKINSVSCISGQVRSLIGGGFSAGIKVAKRPWHRIPIDKAHVAEWKPILRELVNVQRKSSVQKTHIDGQNASVTFPVTIPLAQIGGKSWTQLIDDFLNKQFEATQSKAGLSEAPPDAKSQAPGNATCPPVAADVPQAECR